jgi:hypothetical protein
VERTLRRHGGQEDLFVLQVAAELGIKNPQVEQARVELAGTTTIWWFRAPLCRCAISRG